MSIFTSLAVFLFVCALFVHWLDDSNFSTATKNAFIAVEQALAVATLLTFGIQLLGLTLVMPKIW